MQKRFYCPKRQIILLLPAICVSRILTRQTVNMKGLGYAWWKKHKKIFCCKTFATKKRIRSYVNKKICKIQNCRKLSLAKSFYKLIFFLKFRSSQEDRLKRFNLYSFDFCWLVNPYLWHPRFIINLHLSKQIKLLKEYLKRFFYFF